MIPVLLRVSIFYAKFLISRRKWNQIRKYFNPLVSGPDWFKLLTKLEVENLVGLSLYVLKINTFEKRGWNIKTTGTDTNPIQHITMSQWPHWPVLLLEREYVHFTNNTGTDNIVALKYVFYCDLYAYYFLMLPSLYIHKQEGFLIWFKLKAWWRDAKLKSQK